MWLRSSAQPLEAAPAATCHAKRKAAVASLTADIWAHHNLDFSNLKMVEWVAHASCKERDNQSKLGDGPELNRRKH